MIVHLKININTFENLGIYVDMNTKLHHGSIIYYDSKFNKNKFFLLCENLSNG